MPTLMLPGARKPRRGKLKRAPRLPFPTRAERAYEALLADRTEEMHRFLLDRLMPALEQAAASLDAGRPTRTDDDRDEVERVFDTLRRVQIDWERVGSPAQLSLPLTEIGQEVSAVGKAGLSSQFKSVAGIDPLIGDEGLAARLALFRAANVELIKTIDQRYFGEINGIVQRGLAAGTRPETMAKGIAKEYNVSLGRARVIARDQTSKLHGQLNRLRQEDLGIRRYIWRTAMDERVRDTHAALAGRTFDYNEPPEPGNPGEDFQCRCFAEPDIEELLSRLESEPAGEELN